MAPFKPNDPADVLADQLHYAATSGAQLYPFRFPFAETPII